MEIQYDLAKRKFAPGGVGGWVRELGGWVAVFSKFKDRFKLINIKTISHLPITGMGPFQVIADQTPVHLFFSEP